MALWITEKLADVNGGCLTPFIPGMAKARYGHACKGSTGTLTVSPRSGGWVTLKP